MLRFLWGWFFVLTLVSRTQTSERFPRIATWIGLGIAGFCVFLACKAGDGVGNPTLLWMRLAALVATVLGSFLYAFTTARGTRIAGFLFYALAPIFVLWGLPGSQKFNFFTSALMFGSVFVGQYLGHWYLTVANLHINQLKNVVRVMFAALLIKSLEISHTLWARSSDFILTRIDEMGRPVGIDISKTVSLAQLNAGQALFGIEGDGWMGLGTFGILILVTRLLWGILAPLILAYMVKKTVDMRSTQSATGILYALCVMIIIGEGAALYLSKSLGISL